MSADLFKFVANLLARAQQAGTAPPGLSVFVGPDNEPTAIIGYMGNMQILLLPDGTWKVRAN